jgi:broad specificity phosphatase PhoE
MNFYIFRHAITYFSKNNLPYGDQIESAEILPEGVPAIERLGKYLKDISTDSNFTSPYKRCIQTSNIVTKMSEKNFVVDANLRDWDYRNETLDAMIQRIKLFMENITNQKLSSIAICTHGYPINAIISYIKKGMIDESDLDGYPDPGVLVIIKGRSIEYKDFNS